MPRRNLHDSESIHLAVIMARGESSRMGQPKGLCRLPGASCTFVESIARLYQELKIPVLLVLQAEHLGSYQECLSGYDVEFHTASGGGDTAQTLAEALSWAEEKSSSASCFWAHPVDLPLVRVMTLQKLYMAYENQPEKALRPWSGDLPGHPVLLPKSHLKRVLGNQKPAGTMAQSWAEAGKKGIVEPYRPLAVDDPGVVKDFDHPSQIDLGPGSKGLS